VVFALGVGVALAVTQLGDGGAGSPDGGGSTTADRPGGSDTTASSSTTPAPSTTSTTAPTSTTSTTGRPPAPPTRATVLRQGGEERPVVALTFDAGSDAGWTSRILDLLAARGVKASFGLTGRWVEQQPQLARRIVDEGHVVINHTRGHPSFTGFSTGSAPLATSERLAELRSAEDVIRGLTGADARPWFRPPYGDYDDSVLVDVASAGYGFVVMWSIDSLGWRGLDPAQVAARTIGGLRPGAIVLMHVGSASTDADALPAVLDALDARGLRPVTVAELVGG
jgi:peptidoglycan/xylan/chitin deacetylase (PgdA/CDA1 family)